VAATETAAAAINASQATSQAVTATAAWQMLDADQDGLTNIQEIQNTTDINNPDTDADGLKDGEELTVWSTYPLTPDSDGDGLKDGEEIQRGTHPLKRDTDGDGLDDGSDPDPVHFPTATLIPTHIYSTAIFNPNHQFHLKSSRRPGVSISNNRQHLPLAPILPIH
jgi:hypothetical protein